jgi:hypothetical protein
LKNVFLHPPNGSFTEQQADSLNASVLYHLKYTIKLAKSKKTGDILVKTRLNRIFYINVPRQAAPAFLDALVMKLSDSYLMAIR